MVARRGSVCETLDMPIARESAESFFGDLPTRAVSEEAKAGEKAKVGEKAKGAKQSSTESGVTEN